MLQLLGKWEDHGSGVNSRDLAPLHVIHPNSCLISFGQSYHYEIPNISKQNHISKPSFLVNLTFLTHGTLLWYLAEKFDAGIWLPQISSFIFSSNTTKQKNGERRALDNTRLGKRGYEKNGNVQRFLPLVGTPANIFI